MAEMVDAIKTTVINEMKTALAAYYPATPVAMVDDYINERGDAGDPPAMAGQWYCAIHKPVSRNETDNGGQPYIGERWSVSITISVRSAFAPDSRWATPQALLNALVRAATMRIINRPYDILAAINTLFNATYASTNGLTEPFKVQEPMPQRQNRDPQWLKAISHKRSSQIPAISATITLTNALHIQTLGGAA